MKTRRPFATISYNTIPFLRAKLNEMVQRGYIDFYAFIEHLPEEDETKVHKHLYVEPSGEINTSVFVDNLKEIDLTSELPLGCIRCVPSKFADWYMYALHDKDYLATKLEVRKYNYTDADLVVSDTDTLKELVHTADLTKYKAFKKFRESVESGVPFRELFKNGFIPVQQIKQYEYAYYLIKGERVPDNYTQRNGRRGHEVIVDTATGEVIARELGSADSGAVQKYFDNM